MNKREMQESYDMTIAMLTTQAESEGLTREDMGDFLRCVMLAKKWDLKVSMKHEAMAVAVGTLWISKVPGPVLFLAEPDAGPTTLH